MDPSFHPLPATPMFIFETHAALAIVYSELPVQSMRVAANVLDRDVRMTCILERTVNFKDRRRNKKYSCHRCANYVTGRSFMESVFSGED